MTDRDTQDVAAQVETFLRRRFLVRPGDTGFTRAVNLWEDGYVDSMGVVEVIHYLEQTFSIRIPESLLFSEDFTNIDGIARVVVALRERETPTAAQLEPGQGQARHAGHG